MVRVKIAQAREEDVFQDVLRMNHRHRRDEKGDLIPAGSVCQIEIAGRKTLVVARGTNDSESVACLDEALRTKLSMEAGDEVEVRLQRANFISDLFWGWNASHSLYRTASRLAVLSVALGGLGVILGAISLFK